ncbi:MAG: hypothetical protein JW954_01225 [Dehalococcoidaceae bacterium]|nr:hypothetical protein [Dehalococcoidaceae bacterium]
MPFETTSAPEPDRNSDFNNYRDEGCELSPSCLGCPLPCCAYELEGGVNRIIKSRRNDKILEQAKKGVSPGSIAKNMKVSRRTVQRILQFHRKEIEELLKGDWNEQC